MTDKSYRFCDHCGKELAVVSAPVQPKQEVTDPVQPPQEVPAAAAPKCCPVCGAKQLSGAMFCDECGAKI